MSPDRRYRTYDPAKHLTVNEAVKVCRIARDVVDDFMFMRDYPTQANVDAFTQEIEKLRKIVAVKVPPAVAHKEPRLVDRGQNKEAP